MEARAVEQPEEAAAAPRFRRACRSRCAREVAARLRWLPHHRSWNGRVSGGPGVHVPPPQLVLVTGRRRDRAPVRTLHVDAELKHRRATGCERKPRGSGSVQRCATDNGVASNTPLPCTLTCTSSESHESFEHHRQDDEVERVDLGTIAILISVGEHDEYV